MYKNKTLMVLLFAAIIVGVSVVTAQAYKVPKPNYLTLGISLFTSTDISKAQIATTKGEMAIAKGDLEKIINDGFNKWLLKERELNPYTILRNDTERVKSLFFQFLNENLKYQEYFKQYDIIPPDGYNAVPETPQFDLIIEKGQMVKSWSYNITINDNEFNVECKQYELNINDTTQTVVKATLYNSEGVIVADPDFYVAVVPLYTWVWYGWLPVYIQYGEDDYLYIRFRWFVDMGGGLIVNEAWNYYIRSHDLIGIGYAVSDVLGTLISEIVSTAVGGEIGAVLGFVISQAYGSFGSGELQNFQYETWLALMKANETQSHITTLQIVHYIYPWTLLWWMTSWTQFVYIWPDGQWRLALPSLYTPGVVKGYFSFVYPIILQ